MSSWMDLHKKLYKLDNTIINKLEVLINNQLSNEEYLDYNTSKMLEEPLVFSNYENFDFTEMPKDDLLEVIDTFKSERIELARMFQEVNGERKVTYFFVSIH